MFLQELIQISMEITIVQYNADWFVLQTGAHHLNHIGVVESGQICCRCPELFDHMIRGARPESGDSDETKL